MFGVIFSVSSVSSTGSSASCVRLGFMSSSLHVSNSWRKHGRKYGCRRSYCSRTHVGRHPGHEHGGHEHFHESHGPAQLPTLAVNHIGVGHLGEVTHAENLARKATKLRRASLDGPQGIALLQPRSFPHRFQRATLLQLLPPLVGRHHAPVRDHDGASVIAVAVAQKIRAVRRITGRDHQYETGVYAHELPAHLSKLPPELVQRGVLHIVAPDRTALALLVLQQFLSLLSNLSSLLSQITGASSSASLISLRGRKTRATEVFSDTHSATEKTSGKRKPMWTASKTP